MEQQDVTVKLGCVGCRLNTGDQSSSSEEKIQG